MFCFVCIDFLFLHHLVLMTVSTTYLIMKVCFEGPSECMIKSVVDVVVAAGVVVIRNGE